MKFGQSRPKIPTFQETLHPPHQRANNSRNNSFAPNVPNIIQQNNANITKKPQSFEGIFDDLMERAQSEPISQVIELCLQPLFDSSHTILWVYLERQDTLYSPSFTLFAPSQTNSNLIADGFISRVPIAINVMKDHPVYSQQIDGRIIPPLQPLLMVPIISRDNRPIGVIQFSRKQDRFFTSHEVAVATFLVSKFKIYSGLLFPNKEAQLASADVTKFGTQPDVIKGVCASLSRSFRCRKSEIWVFKTKKNLVIRYDDSSDSAQYIDPEKTGCAGFAALKNVQINEHSVLDHKACNEYSDGFHDETVLINPYRVSPKKVWVVALRGRANPPYFSKSDEVALKAVTPFAIRSISCSVSPAIVTEHLNEYQQRLTALLEVAEALSGVLDLEQLIPLIMDRSCVLLNAERCSLFLVDPIKKELVTRFAGGMSKAIRIPIGKGIVGTTATTGEIVNIPDAYKDKRFDPSVDKKTGFRTVSILALPIYNNRGEIAGVTEMINRKDGGAFDEDDIKLMMGFNVFCGISLDNAKLYNASLDLARQLRTFVDISTQLNQKSTIRASIENILENARGIVNATRATLYLCSADNEITLLVTVGEPPKNGIEYATQAVAQKDIITISTEERRSSTSNSQRVSTGSSRNGQGESLNEAINRILDNPSELEKLAGISASSSTSDAGIRGSRVLKAFENPNDLESEMITSTEQVCCLPLFNSESKIIGVMELASNQRIMSEDIKLLESFAIFSAVSIERSHLKDIATLGDQEGEIRRLILPYEADMCNLIPTKLRLTEEQTNHIFTISFDSPQWDGIGHIQVLFAIFSRYEIPSTFNISNEKLFRFICEMRDTYNPVPYHNWRHAVDVTQFVSYQIAISNLKNVLTKFELFALLVSGICHDANHDGFTNVYNVKAETPLGILFKNQSVMETHHCSVSIGVLSKPQNNLFESLLPAEYKKMWTTIIQLILATDMAKHFELLKQFNQLKDDNQYTMENEEHRLLTMQLVLKCGDISNVSRPFELADKWCDVLCEEFFRQGDLEMANGMEYTSDLNDRAHLDKPKSQIGFYTFVCLPLFEAMARAVPELIVNVNQVKSNLSIWKKQKEQKDAEAEAAASANADTPAEAPPAEGTEVKETENKEEPQEDKKE